MLRYALLMIVILALAACGGNRVVNDTFANGQTKVSGALVSGKQEGAWRYFYEDGSLRSEGAWQSDYQDGPWIYYYQNGKKKQAGTYDLKLRQGPWTYWYENGEVYCRGSYAADRQDQVWQYFHTDGRPFSVGTFDAGVKHGLWRWLAGDNGMFYQGQRIGPWQIDGQERDKGVPAGMQLKQEQRADGTQYFALVDTEGTLMMSWVRAQQKVVSAYDAASETFVSVHGNGRLAAVLSGDTLQLWHANGQIASDGTAFYLADGTAIPDLTLAADGPGSELIIMRKQALAAKNTMSKVPAEKKPSVASKPELIMSKASEPALTPVVHIASLWTKREEKKVGRLVSDYTSALPGEDEYSAGFDERDMEAAWMEKPLPKTRFFTYTGNVIDIDNFKDKKSVTMIVMRGFAGQVCVYCSTQTRVIAEQIAKFQELDNEVVIVYPGPAETIPMFMKAVKSVGGDASGLSIVLDVNLSLVKSLDVIKDLSKPCSIILDKNGKVIYGYVGKNMGDRPSVKELLKYVKKAH